MTADSSYQLDALERQWRDTKAPKLGLQLAEAHRREGDLDAAIAVLETGLETHPDHTSTRVALSRYLVDSDRFEAALEHLLRIVQADPVHLVANKLLVRAYLGLGRTEEASDKLDIYEMLGEGDEEIESLRLAVGSAASPAVRGGRALVEPASVEPGSWLDGSPFAEVAATAEPAQPGEPAESVEPGERVAVLAPAAAAVESPAAPSPGLDGLEDESKPEPEPADEAALESDPFLMAPVESTEEPFGSGWAPEEASGYWDKVGEEGIFAVAGQADFESHTTVEALEAVPAFRESDGEVVNVPATEASNEAVAEIAAERGSEIPEPAPVLDGSGQETTAESTMTLGNLYLEQGHTEQAEATFREVLTREPGNGAALEALEAIGLPSSVGQASLAERKKAVVIAYRARLRRALEVGV